MSSGATSATSSIGSEAATSSPICDGSTASSSTPVSAAACSGFGGEVVPDHDQLRAGVAEVVLDLPGGQQDIHRYDDRPETQRGVIDHRKVGDVRQHHADPVAAPDSLARQQPGDAPTDLFQARVVDGNLVQTDRDPVRVLLGGFSQQACEIRIQGHLSGGGTRWTTDWLTHANGGQAIDCRR